MKFMNDNYELVQKGFRILVSAMSQYIGMQLSREYKDNWWNEVLDTLSDQKDLPVNGSYGDLIDSLDIANCIRLIDRKWANVFRNYLSQNCRTWSKELMGVRNHVAHIGNCDLEQPTAERALDTMALLCNELDDESAQQIREIYNNVRQKAIGKINKDNSEKFALEQPKTMSKRGELLEGNLLQMIDTDIVQKTSLTRKVTFGNKTEVYPVYKVRLDALYYNDQNDRIATWITRYETENGIESLSKLKQSYEEYNDIIEQFIVESNQESINKTQKNIALVGQRQAGVTLSDGRIVDGNRRFTCLRRLQKQQQQPLYFETVIMDMDIHVDRKQIKILELAVQHGEEKKVEYDPIDYAIGTYRDVVKTKLLTESEYAASTNEPISDVRKRIDIAQIIDEFLAYLKLTGQYHAARDYQVYDLFQEMLIPLKQLNQSKKEELKTIVFQNILLKTISDRRKFIRDIKNLIKTDNYELFFNEQLELGQKIRSQYIQTDIQTKIDAEKFADKNDIVGEEMQLSLERALRKSRVQQLKSKPHENVSKCISLMMEVDPRLFEKLDTEDKDTLKNQLYELTVIIERFKNLL